ncbi:MAG: hypothetical protein ACLUKN_09635 [Bacilli bacterium]
MPAEHSSPTQKKSNFPTWLQSMVERPQMFEKGIAEMGGMSRFVKKGQTVNKAEHRLGQAANTAQIQTPTPWQR